MTNTLQTPGHGFSGTDLTAAKPASSCAYVRSASRGSLDNVVEEIGELVAKEQRERRARGLQPAIVSIAIVSIAIVSRTIVSIAIVSTATVSTAIVSITIVSIAIVSIAIVSISIVSIAIVSIAIVSRTIVSRAIVSRAIASRAIVSTAIVSTACRPSSTSVSRSSRIGPHLDAQRQANRQAPFAGGSLEHPRQWLGRPVARPLRLYLGVSSRPEPPGAL